MPSSKVERAPPASSPPSTTPGGPLPARAHGDSAGTRALVEVPLLHRHLDGEHVVAGLAAALRAGTLTADDTAGQPAPGGAPAFPQTVASLTARRLDKLAPDTRPLPSVAAYDQLLRRTRTAQEGPRL